MKKLATILLTLLLSLNAICQVPVITMTTAKDIGSEFSITLYAYSANTPIQVDFGDGNLVNKTVGITYTSISGTLVGSQTVKIYGSGYFLLDCSSMQLTALDVTQYTALENLKCYDNQLTTLDVTKNTKLTELDCGGNQLTSLDVTKNTLLFELDCISNHLTSLDVTKNTALTELWCGNNQLTSLDVTKNTKLTKLRCFSNQLTSLDVTIFTELIDLNCGFNQLTTLDVTKNTALTELWCGNNQLTSLDVTKNTALTEFWCGNNQLTSLDVTKNTKLTELRCFSNQLKILDLTKNIALTWLECERNQLTTLDLTKNTALTHLSCFSNQLTFASLPIKQTSWETFTYSPQQPISIAKSTYIGEELDLSIQNLINGNTTVYTWKTKRGLILLQGTDYTITNGKTIFLKDPIDSVYCELTNATFPNLNGYNILKTTCTKLICTNAKCHHGVTLTTSKAIGSVLSFSLKSDFYNTPIQIDFGDGNLVNKTISTYTTTINDTLVGSQTVKIYGNRITYLDCDYNQLTSLDLTQNTALTYLNCSHNQLNTLDLTQNIELTSFDCDFNHLTLNSLPIKQTNWEKYSYSPQQPVPIVKTIRTGVELDLSNQKSINGNTTVYKWKTKGGTPLAQGTDYNITDGKTVFLKTPTDSVYCEMTNATFPDLTLKTTCTKITSTTAIKNLDASEIEIYTNQNTLYINTPYNAQVSIFETNGRLVLSKELTSGSNSIQLENIGIYLVKVLGNKGVSTKKVFIK